MKPVYWRGAGEKVFGGAKLPVRAAVCGCVLAAATSLAALAVQPQGPGQSPAKPSGPNLEGLSFLGGVWHGKSKSGAYVEEYWSRARGDSMVGHCRFIKDGKTTFYELMAIVATPSGLVLRLRHCNGEFEPWPENEEAGDCFVSKFVAGKEVTFDNKSSSKHVRVRYRKKGSGKLLAEVEESKDGKTSTFVFEYLR